MRRSPLAGRLFCLMISSFTVLTVLFQTISCQPSFPITQENREGQIYDVVIVGAGLTGLVAARQIRRTQPRAAIMLLEARGQVGGRIRTKSMATAAGDEWIDQGSQFVSPAHHEIIDLARELELKFHPQATCGERTILFDRKRGRTKRQITRALGQSAAPTFEQLANSSSSQQLARQTVDEFVRTNIQNLSLAGADSINRLLQTFFDAPSETVSALQIALTTTSDNTTVPDLLRELGHGRGLLLDGGMFQLVRNLADGMHIRYSEPVVEINEMINPVQIKTTQNTYSAKQVIVTAPLVTLPQIRFQQPLDYEFMNLIENYKPTGHAYYFTMTYEIAFWRNAGKSGQIIYTSEDGPIAWMTAFDMGYGPGCGQIKGQTGILWGIAHFNYNLPDDARHNQYVQILAKTMQNTEHAPLDVSDIQFSADPFAMGSVGVLKPGFDTNLLNLFKGFYANDLANLYFASAELSNRSTGMMNGAVIAGMLVGDAVSNYGYDDVVECEKQPGIRKFENALMRDVPVSEHNEQVNEQANVPGHFTYHTSTHYPPDTFKDLVENNTPHSYQPIQTSTPFVYSTSSHYPPEIFEDKTKSNDQQAQRDAVHMHSQSPHVSEVTPFPYHTSSHYPELPSLETTTFKHFSFGNLEEFGDSEDENEIRVLNDEEARETITASNDPRDEIGFHYETSSINPRFDNIATTTMRHFSFGNLNDEQTEGTTENKIAMFFHPVQAQSNNLHFDSVPLSTANSQPIETTFHYETTSHYPPTSGQPSDTPFFHFSMGNLDEKPSDTQSQQHAYRGQMSNILNPESANSEGIKSELNELANESQSMEKLTLASRLLSIVQRLIDSVRSLQSSSK